MDRCCGLDVHKDSAFACILDAQGQKILEKRYETLTSELAGLRDTLAAYGCGRAAMESTNIHDFVIATPKIIFKISISA